jgi:hypothetical protein
MKFRKIGFGTPINERILLYWEGSKHIEVGMIVWDDVGADSHLLSDDERLSVEPSHWMYLPEVIGD